MSDGSIVEIVTSDRGWILERLANEITQRLPYVRCSGVAADAADVRYYMTYSTWRRRLARVEIGYFAHLEPDPKTKEFFFEVARNVDHCVCHSRLYEAVLRDAGIATVTTISPGVDLDRFVPKVRIGVVGRTYHTGRKGEHLVAQVMDVPGIEWVFTGEGWPGPASPVPDEALPDFYNSLDYVLVPSLYEGGPMCVVEALACGRPVIAPPVGWVPDFPHLEFETGNAADLRRVLQTVVADRNRLRETVLDRTWDAWAEGHDRLFRGLMDRAGLAPARAVASWSRVGAIALVLHGSESNSQGGPSVRVPRTALEMQRHGFAAQTLSFPDPAMRDADLIHGFNVWSPSTALALSRRARELAKPFVLSPIYIDLGASRGWNRDLLRLFAETTDPAALDAGMAALAERHRDPKAGVEPVPGYHAMVREMISTADHVILLSEHERAGLAAIGAVPPAATVVHNPVDHARFCGADAAPFVNAYGVKDFVLCVARIEPRKNQLLLLHALRDTGLPIVLIGHASNSVYLKLIERYLGPNVHVIGRIDPASDLVPSAYSTARVVVLPSWAEGAPLAALEAAASGASLVLSDRSSEREYFGAMARYCDPADPASIRRAVLDAYDSPPNAAARADQMSAVGERFSWDRHVAGTLTVYERTIESFAPRAGVPRPAGPAEVPSPLRIVFDVTTSAEHKGRWTGISRVEAALARTIAGRDDVDVSFTAWRNDRGAFVSVPAELVERESLNAYVTSAAEPQERPPAGSFVVVAGSAWMQNARYAQAVARLVTENDLRLVLLLHDLISVRFPFWFNKGYAPVFERNLALLLSVSDVVVAISESTKRDVEEFAIVKGLFVPPVRVIREGDDHIDEPDAAPFDHERVEALVSKPFVLCVGAIHHRKNHRLLYDVWLRLAKTLGTRCPRLIIVGGVAWNGADTERAFREDARLRRHVEIVEDVDDATLRRLYEECLVTVYPSLYEGWGLPVVESLGAGKICLASNTSSIPEISAECTDLLDPVDPVSWATRIQLYVTSSAARSAREAAIRAGYKGATWSDCVSTLIGVLGDPSARPTAWPYVLGTVVSLRDPVSAFAVLGAGWFGVESWGVWSARATASIRLSAGGLGAAGAAILVAKARSLATASTPQVCEVVVDDRTLARWTLRRGDTSLLTAVLPAEVVAGRDELVVSFRVAHLVQISDATKNKKDTRRIGIGLVELAVCALADGFASAEYLGDVDAVSIAPLGRALDCTRSREPGLTFVRPMTVSPGWGAYSTAGPTKLLLHVVDAPTDDLVLEVARRAVASPSRPLSLSVLVNGRPVGKHVLTDSGLAVDRMRIPAAIRHLRQPMEVEFFAVASGSPANLGIGNCPDHFALGILDLRLDRERAGVASEASRPAAGTYALGTTVRLDGTAGVSPIRFDAGWRRHDQNGMWTLGPQGTLSISLSAPARSDLLVWVACAMAGVPAGRPAAITLRARGVEVAAETWTDVREGALVGALRVDPTGTETVDLTLAVVTWADSSDDRTDLYPTAGLTAIRLAPLPHDAFDQAAAIGDAHRDARNWAGAVPHYERALSLRPDAAGIRVQLGHMLKESGRFAEAEDCYREAARHMPGDADVVFQLGHLMNRQADYSRAYGYYVRAHHLDPNSADIRHHVTWAAKQIRGLGLPLPTELEADGATGPERAIASGDVHAERGNWQLAAECFEQALALCPESETVLARLEEAYRKNGHPNLAEALRGKSGAASGDGTGSGPAAHVSRLRRFFGKGAS